MIEELKEELLQAQLDILKLKRIIGTYAWQNGGSINITFRTQVAAPAIFELQVIEEPDGSVTYKAVDENRV